MRTWVTLSNGERETREGRPNKKRETRKTQDIMWRGSQKPKQKTENDTIIS